MGETLKEILLMGIGAVSMTGEKANELKQELMEKGKVAYKEGMVKNEELKRKIKDEVKENTTINYTTTTTATKEDIMDILSNLTDEEKEQLQKILSTKTDANSDTKKNNENKEEKK